MKHDTLTITMPDGTTSGPVPLDAFLAASAQVVDELTADAAAFVIRERKCSSSLVQRKYAIGYNRAARIVESLEALGIVTAADHVGKREVVAQDVPADLVKAAAAQKKTKAVPMKETAEDVEVRDNAYRVTADELRAFIERIERLEQEKKDIADQVKEVFAESKARGYDSKVIRRVIALRKREPDDIAEEEAILEIYKQALGMA